MAQITKIYELKTLGYDQVITQLKSIDQAFASIKKTKQELNNIKFSADDADRLRSVNEQLKIEKINTAELRLEKQRLTNEAKALQNARQAEINQSKAAQAQNVAEGNSLADLIAKRKALFALLSTKNPTGATGGPAGGNTGFDFEGQKLNFQQGTALYQQMTNQIAALKSNINGAKVSTQEFSNALTPMEQAGQRVTTALSNGFASMRGQLTQMIFTYTGWFAAFQEAGKLIKENVQLSDSFADMQIRIHGTKDDVEKLFESLKKIDTRTSLKDLVDIANVVAKKGVAKDEIAALTAEFDKLNVVLGAELGGPATSTASIIKLITIFNDDKHVTAERVQEIGVALTKLTTSGVATGDYLINFAERVGAVRGITGLTLQPVLGMGAALQQLGQRAELAGTAAVQLTTKMFSDVPKYAEAAKISVEQFRTLLDRNPFEALLAVAKGLKDIPTDQLKTKFEEVVGAFGEVGVTGVRIKAVLGDIATNGDFVAKRMKDAAINTNDFSNQATANTLKQNTFAASLDRIKKGLEEIGTSTAFRVTLSAVATLILLVVNNLGLITAVIGTYAVAWSIANASMIQAAVATRLLNAWTVIQYAGLVIAKTFTDAYNASVLFMTGATNSATVATRLLNVSMRLLPIGILITLVAIFAAGCTTLTAKVQGTTKALQEKAKADIAMAEVVNKANDAIAEQEAKLDSLVKVVTSVNTSYDTSRAALGQLIEINGRFSAALQGNVINLNEVKRALADVRGEIELNARAQASASLASEKYKSYLDLVSLRQRFESASSTGTQVSQSELTQAQKDFLAKNIGILPKNSLNVNLLGTVTSYSLTPDNIVQFKKNMEAYEKDAFDAYDQYNSISADFQKKVTDSEAAKRKNATVVEGGSLRADIAAAMKSPQSEEELKSLIDRIDKERKSYKEGDVRLKELQDARDAFQDRLDKINNKQEKTPAYRGAKLTGQDRDQLAEIETQRKLALASAEQQEAEQKASHRKLYTEEIDYSNKIADINQLYVKKKIAYLNSLKSLNAAQKLDLATFNKELFDIENKRLDDIQKIKDKEFNEQKRSLTNTLNNNINDIQVTANSFESDATIPAAQRAQIKLNADTKILELQEKFNKDIDALEIKLNQKTTENTKLGAQTREAILKDMADVLNGTIKDIGDQADIAADRFKNAANQKIISILNANKSPAETAKLITQVDNELNRQLLLNDRDRIAKELLQFEQGHGDKLKSQKDYLDALQKYWEIERKLAEDNSKKTLSIWDNFTKALKQLGDSIKENILGIKSYTDDDAGKAQKRADAVADSERDISAAIAQSFQAYFDNANRKIDLETKAKEARLDNETAQLKARAQSAAEEDSIDRQQAAKKAEIEKKAGEEKKKNALKELEINYAIAVIKSLAQYGLPIALIPIAAETALYFVQRSAINQQQFEHGGQVVPTRTGGSVRGKSHTHGGVPFNYEAEGDELMVINKKSAQKQGEYTVTGSLKQIASKVNELGGGVAFSRGAIAQRRFDSGGILGSNYSAPNYTPSSAYGNSDNLRAEIINLAIEQSKRIDRIEVVQQTQTVTDAQKKAVKQNMIGVLA